jgi:probable HAF family extracellular repeat protein
LDARGDAAGESFTNSTANPTTGLPTLHPFLWRNGVMHDLGSLGGTLGVTNWMNNHGQVVGQATPAGDNFFHPFLSDGHRLIDLGTLGGDFGSALWVNNRGAVVGQAALPGDQTAHGFLWSHGTMQDLPPIGGDLCSQANVINARGQVVGADSDCGNQNLNAVLWQNGSSFDLNTLLAPIALHLTEAFFISPSGEIACLGTLPNGDSRVAILTPIAGADGRFAPTSATQPTHSHEMTERTVPDRRDLFSTVRDRIVLLSNLGPR